MRDRFSALEWHKLLRLPGVVFMAVAMADGRADSGEQNCFLDYLNQSSHVDPLVRALFNQVAEKGPEALEVEQLLEGHVAFLEDIRNILEQRLSQDERRTFLAGLLGLGHHVAAATGGFFGLGNRVSAVEEARLAEVSQALGLPQLLNSFE